MKWIIIINTIAVAFYGIKVEIQSKSFHNIDIILRERYTYVKITICTVSFGWQCSFTYVCMYVFECTYICIFLQKRVFGKCHILLWRLIGYKNWSLQFSSVGYFHCKKLVAAWVTFEISKKGVECQMASQTKNIKKEDINK